MVMAFMVRYTSGLMIIPMSLYILMNYEDIKQLKNLKKILAGIVLELGVLIAGLAYFFTRLKTGDSVFSLFASIASSSFTGVNDVAHNTNVLYYIQNLLNYISMAHFGELISK